MKRNIIIFLILYITSSYAAFEHRPTGARPESMGNAYTASADDIFSINENPAGLSYLKGLNFAFNGYQFFPTLDIDKIYSFNFATAYPIPRIGTMALYYQSFGFSLYRETEIVFSHSFTFYRKIALGYNLKYLNLSIQDFGSDTCMALDLGLLAAYSANWRFGLVAKNINAPAIAGSSDNINRGGEIGIAWLPKAGLTVSATIAKNMGEDFFFKIGNEIHLFKFLYLRTGFKTDNMSLSAGLGLQFTLFHFDYALIYQNNLGPQSILSLNFDFSRAQRSVFRETKKAKKGTITLADLGPESRNYEGDKININTADADELVNLPRIGPSAAQRIIEYRKKHGPFKRKEDIINVPRIGVKTYAKFRELITVGNIVETNGQVKVVEEKSYKNINDISLRELIKLKVPPFVAVKIINYRDSKGKIKSIDEIKKIEGLTQDDLKTIIPILKPLFHPKETTK